MQNTIVVRFQDKSMLKGTTSDFFPTKDVFHVVENGTGKITVARISEVKAVFFVKTYEGDKDRTDHQNVERMGLGKKIMVTFDDGEIILGYATSYSKKAIGFFVFPSDAESNNDRIFVVNAATREVQFLINT